MRTCMCDPNPANKSGAMLASSIGKYFSPTMGEADRKVLNDYFLGPLFHNDQSQKL